LFTPSFIRELIALGYQDTLWNAQAITRFFDDGDAALNTMPVPERADKG
jgi:hypothetical protein